MKKLIFCGAILSVLLTGCAANDRQAIQSEVQQTETSFESETEVQTEELREIETTTVPETEEKPIESEKETIEAIEKQLEAGRPMLEDYPRVDGSTATIPLSEQYLSDFMNIPIEQARLYTLHNKTHKAYENLIERTADIIFVTAPSEEEQQLAKDAGVELEIIPVVKEGFVFLVNKNNPVRNLTQQQIVDIYSGVITNWKDVDGDDEEIIAYQRPENSGSQSGMLSLVMKDTPLMEAPAQSRSFEMWGLVEAVATYDRGKYSLGYSYYYYVDEMYFKEGIQLLKVDGIAPGMKTIQDDSYPYTTAYYAVIRKDEPEDSKARKLLQWIEENGHISAEKAGYVPIK